MKLTLVSLRYPLRIAAYLGLLIGLHIGSVAAADPSAATENNPPRPNVLFIAVDDMKDWVNCLGGYEGNVKTPNIDRLARRGTLFTNAHCVSPKCAPSRAALLTGLLPSTTGLYDNGHWWLPNLPDVVTIPAQFRRHGYHVTGAGKIFHHTAGNHPPNQWDEFHPIRFREDPWYRGNRLNYPWSKHGPYPDGFPFSGVAGLGHENDWGPLDISEDRYDDEATLDYVVRFLEGEGVNGDPKQEADKAQKGRPFFLACGFFRPHLPWYVPKRFFDRYPLDEVILPKTLKQDRDDLPAVGRKLAKARQRDFELIRDANKWKHAVRAYLASITCVDARIGRVLDALDKNPDAANTIVVLWSDHGWHLGEKQHWHKSTLWEEATRVPLIISAPGYKPAICDRPVSLLDLYPTLNQLAELRDPGRLDGRSLVPLLRNPNAPWSHSAIIEYQRGNVAVRSKRFRYIHYNDGGEELYDHDVDAYEWTNLASNERFAEEKARLASLATSKWATPALPKKSFEFDPTTFTWTNKKTGHAIQGKTP